MRTLISLSIVTLVMFLPSSGAVLEQTVGGADCGDVESFDCVEQDSGDGICDNGSEYQSDPEEAGDYAKGDYKKKCKEDLNDGDDNCQGSFYFAQENGACN